MRAMSRTIPLPPLPPSSSPHLILRRFLRPISAATPPLLHVPPFSLSPPSFLLHSLSASHKLAAPLHRVALVDQTHTHEFETAYNDKVVDSETNVLAVNDVVLEDADEDKVLHSEAVNEINDGVLDEEEIDNSEFEPADEDKVVESKTNNSALNDDVLEEETDNSDFEVEDEDSVVDSEEEAGNESSNVKTRVVAVNEKPAPSLSIKEKKELASYAHSLGKKLKSQQVGKSGVTDTVVTALIETLEKNELLKLKIHGNCPVELDDAIKQIEMGTGSVAVSQIGRTVILYRPSVSKLQAEQKKKEARRKLMKKRPAWVRSSSQSKEEMPKLTARGRRGSSRV